MGFVTWMIAGALLGGAASTLIGTRDLRLIAWNVATGIAGVMFGAWLLGMLIGASAFDPGTFALGSLLVSLLGAALLLAVLHEFRGAHYQSARTKIKQTLEIERLITAGLAGILALVGFLNHITARKVEIEGHTDNVGSDDSNLGLSQRPADSVKSFLVHLGHRLAADRRLRQERTPAGRGQTVRERPPAEPPRRSVHRQACACRRIDVAARPARIAWLCACPS